MIGFYCTYNYKFYFKFNIFFLHKGNAQASTAHQTSTVQKIPVRATLISALSIVPCVLVLTGVFLLNLDKEDIAMWGRVAMLASGAIRCPTIGLVKK